MDEEDKVYISRCIERRLKKYGVTLVDHEGKERTLLSMFMIKEDDNNILPFGY
jgi:hypothetical protein